MHTHSTEIRYRTQRACFLMPDRPGQLAPEREAREEPTSSACWRCRSTANLEADIRSGMSWAFASAGWAPAGPAARPLAQRLQELAPEHLGERRTANSKRSPCWGLTQQAAPAATVRTARRRPPAHGWAADAGPGLASGCAAPALSRRRCRQSGLISFSSIKGLRSIPPLATACPPRRSGLDQRALIAPASSDSTISTRRFSWRPSALSLLATG